MVCYIYLHRDVGVDLKVVQEEKRYYTLEGAQIQTYCDVHMLDLR